MNTAGDLGACADAVERACFDLVSGTPATLERCGEALEAAARRMGSAHPGVERSADALAQAWRLRQNVRRARALLENAAAYHRGWQERVAVRVAGYAPGGLPGDVAASGRIWLEA